MEKKEIVEPAVVLNGHTLTTAEVMTLRVAIETFTASLITDGLGEDEVGKSICDGYIYHLVSLRRYINHPQITP